MVCPNFFLHVVNQAHAHILILTAYCPHKKRLVGYASDAFDMNVIAQEFNRRCEKASKALEAETTETTAGQEDDVVDAEAPAIVNETSIAKGKVPMGKHYMVFMATTWSS